GAESFAEVAGPEGAFKASCCARGIVRACDEIVVDEIADASAEAMLRRSVVVEELWAAFVLAKLYVAVIRSDRDHAVVSKLMYVIRTGAPGLVDGLEGLRIFCLIAGVKVSGKIESVLDPAAEMAGAKGGRSRRAAPGRSGPRSWNGAAQRFEGC